MRRSVLRAARVAFATAVGLGLALGLLGGGLDVASRIGMAAQEPAGSPRRPPVLNPAVPLNATEEEAIWSYLNRIAPIWDIDRPTVIGLLDQYLARFPGNPVALEKLYVVEVEHAKALIREGDSERARHHLQRAIQIDGERGEAFDVLEELQAAA